MKTILVTGGAGYVGSHACKALKAAGHTPVTFDNLSRGHEHAVKYGPLEVGDILDRDRLHEVITQYQPDAVMHFAAYASVPESVENPAIYYHNNVVGTLTLLEVMAKTGIDKIIFSSTCAVYGEVSQMPITEDTDCHPTNAYGSSKLMVETILRDYARAGQLQAVILRYFNAAGSDPDGEIGDERVPVAAVIPCVVETALGKRDTFQICGADYDTPDGTGIRDYIHIMDLAAAHVSALDYLLNGGSTHVLNLGTGKGNSVREIVQAMEHVSGQPLPVVETDRRPGDLAQIWADSSKANDILGWQPQHADITEMVRTSYAFMQAKKEG